MSKYAEIAKRYYESGQWSRSRIVDLLEAGRITQEEFAEIVGETK